MPSSPDVASEPLLMSAPKAAERLGVSWITFRRLMDDGALSFVQWTDGGTRWIEEDELRRFIKKHRKNAQAGRSVPRASTQRQQRQASRPSAA